ncbi:MAG: hypothetical protein RR475_02550 [Clostridia bacterium]
MGTITRPELSKKSRYWIDRHRYYELKHFCLQYPLWKKMYADLSGVMKSSSFEESKRGAACKTDPTEKCAEKIIFYRDRMDMVEKAAHDAGADLGKYILRGVTEGLSYDFLKSRLDIPCCKDVYYALYRRFFWLLSKSRK